MALPVPPTGNIVLLPRLVINPFFNTNFWQLGNAIGSHGIPPTQATDDQIITFLEQYLAPPVNQLGPARTEEVFCAPATFFRYAYYATSSPNPSSYELGFLPNLRRCLFNSTDFVDYMSADFPAGLQVSNVAINFSNTVIQTGNLSLVTFKTLYSGLQVGFQTYPGAYVVTDPITIFGLNYGFSKMWNEIGFQLTAAKNDLQASACGNIPYVGSTFNMSWFNIIASYSLLSATIGLDTPEGAPGSEISISDPNGGLDIYEEIKLYWIDDTTGELIEEPLIIPPGAFISRTQFNIRFIFPSYVLNRTNTYRILPWGGKRVRVVGSGTQFSGEIPLALLNAVLVDGSGIYRLVPGKRNDTYYDRTDPLDVQEIDLKLPDPVLRTGFLDG